MSDIDYVNTQKIRTKFTRNLDRFNKNQLSDILYVPFPSISNYLHLIQRDILQNFFYPLSHDLYKIIKTFAENIDDEQKTVIGVYIINQNLEILYCLHNSEKSEDYYITIFYVPA